MSHLRRRFLLQLGAGAAALALGKTGTAFAAAASAKTNSAPGYSTFAALVGHSFTLDRAGAKAADVRLIKVVPLKSAKGYADEKLALATCYTLVLQSEQKSALAEGTYEFSGKGIASFSAFMSPIRGDGRSYQVVFN